MKYGRLQEIFEGEEPEFDLIEKESVGVDGNECKEYLRSIIHHKKTDTFFEVNHWRDAGGHGIYPEAYEDFELTEVELVKVTTTIWREKKRNK